MHTTFSAQASVALALDLRPIRRTTRRSLSKTFRTAIIICDRNLRAAQHVHPHNYQPLAQNAIVVVAAAVAALSRDAHETVAQREIA